MILLAILAADQPAEVKAKALDNLRLFLPTKWAALAKSKELDDAITKLFGNEATLRKEGRRLIVEPVEKPSLLALLAGWDALEDTFPPIEELEPLDEVSL